MTRNQYKWARAGDVNAFFGLMLDNVAGLLLMVAFIGVTMLFNLLIGSMSAKYAMFAPIFIPMFMLVGICSPLLFLMAIEWVLSNPWTMLPLLMGSILALGTRGIQYRVFVGLERKKVA